MNCPFCSQSIPDTSKFCSKCGKSIPRCPTCSAVITAKTRFCSVDGTPIPPELVAGLPEIEAPAAAASASALPEQSASAPNRPPKKKSAVSAVVITILLILFLGAGGFAAWKFLLAPSNPPGDAEAAELSDTSAASDEDGLIKAIDIETPEADKDADSTAILATDANESEASSARKADHTYEVIAKDISWTEANRAAEAAGGHLVTITTQEEYDEICRLAEQSGLKYLWLGAMLSSDSMEWGDKNTWITGEDWVFQNWYPGEPSKEDIDGTKEYYLCLWNAKYDEAEIGWTFNDQRNDIAKDIDECKGKVGYIVEYGDDV